jgi:hypothetical protein
MGRISNGCVVARVRWLTHTGREVSPSGLKSGGAKRFGGRCIRVDFRRMSEAGFAAQPIIEQGEAPDTFLISAQDPLPLRLCTFAPLRSFLLVALRAVFPLTPPAPYSPSQSPGGEGEPSGLGGAISPQPKPMRLTRSQELTIRRRCSTPRRCGCPRPEVPPVRCVTA